MSPIPVTNWNQTTIDGIDYLVIDAAQFRVPLDFDPSSNVFIAVAAPVGGLGNFPALVKGDPGQHAEIDDEIDIEMLEYGDATPDSASWTTLTPPDDDTPGLYKLALTLHKGAPGDDGTTVLDMDDFGTPVAKKFLVVNSAADDFEYATQKVGDLYIPAAMNSIGAGNSASTLASVTMGPFDYDWRPIPMGQALIAPSGSDILVNLLARLGNATSGNIIARTFGIAGSNERMHLDPTPPAGSDDTLNRVAAGATANVHLRAERQSGTQTFSISASTSTFGVKVSPIP